MSGRDELAGILSQSVHGPTSGTDLTRHMADAILAAGYRKPRTLTSAYQLESLPFGSAVQTSDESDTVVLKCDGSNFRNQSGYELSATDLWRYGTRPFTVIYEPEATK